MIRRSDHLRFFGGFWAFPGGKVGPEEASIPWAPSGPGDDARLAAKCAAAARELFEETGVLIARTSKGDLAGPDPALAELRRRLLMNEMMFGQILHDRDLAVHTSDFRLIGDVTTPAFAPMRYETTFYAADLPAGQEPDVWPGELAEGRWASARDMLASWTRGDCHLSPPTIMTLEAIIDRPAADAPSRLANLLAALKAGKIHPIFFAPRVQMIPVRTVALPPSTHTNVFLVGTGPRYLLDPGSADPEELQRLFDLLDEERHVGGATACAARYEVPIWSHPWTANRIADRIRITRHIHDGDRLDLGPSPDGDGCWHLQALHTPGHAPGHLAFYEPHYRLLFAGDMVSTVSSVVIAPPEGNLAQYLHSLHRLADLDCRLLLPSHGNVSAQPRKTIEDSLAHRARREEQLVEALASGERTIDDLAPELYRGLPPQLMRLARLQILAGLLKLQAEHRVANSDGERWRLK
jgi:glyoxylase-like metal-dependent hydrolase (beta-lactamase superfamily II)/8-oxo-dGTP pyrophosphatase MutT (NUDIX family)